MKKYILVLLFCLSVLLTACHTQSTDESSEKTSTPYNIAFIIVDDMNAYGFKEEYKEIQMPYLDAFRKSATTFKQAYCAAPVCTPSRASTFSGLYPHTPFTAPQRFYDLYNTEDIQLPKGYRSTDLSDLSEEAKSLLDPFRRFNPNDTLEWKSLLKAYFACNTFADWNVGRVIEAIDDSPYADNTIIVFWSDNGYHCGEKNHWEKNTLWERSAYVPMAIRVPGAASNGQAVTTPVSLVDLYATLVDYCQLELPKTHSLDGKSLRPLIENPDSKWDRPALTSFGKNVVSLRNTRYRFIQYSDGTQELHDLQKDPYEFKNRALDPELQYVIEQFKPFIPKEMAEELPGRKS